MGEGDQLLATNPGVTQRTKVLHLKGVFEAGYVSKGAQSLDQKSFVKSLLPGHRSEVARLRNKTPWDLILLPKISKTANGGDTTRAYLRALQENIG